MRRKLLRSMFLGSLFMPFGEATGQGFVNPGVFTRIIINGAGKQLLVYSGPTPALGNLIYSIATQVGTDKPGNTVLSGAVSYSGGLGTVSAIRIFGNTIEWMSAPAPNGTYSPQAALTGLAGQQLNIAATALTGVLTVPQAVPGNTTLGSTWNATTAAQCNANFANILAALAASGLT